MNQDDDDRSWHLFTSEDMIQGYKALKRRKKGARIRKDQTPGASPFTISPTFQTGNKVAESNENSPLSVLTRALPTPVSQRSSEQGPIIPERTTKKACTRTPLSNITNTPLSNITSIPSGTKVQQKRDKRKGKAVHNDWENIPLNDWSRNLFDEEFSKKPNTAPHLYDDKDETAKEGLYFSDDGLFDSECSEDDMLGSTMDQQDYSSDSASDEEHRVRATQNRTKKRRGSQYVVPEEYATLGSPSYKCIHCHAQLWHAERVNKGVTKGAPIFSICCKKGEVSLPKTPQSPDYLLSLYNDEARGRDFKRSIRLYNAMFAFTSAGGNVDHSINKGRGPYIYRLNGQNHHVFGSLIPDDGDTPKFCQLYIYDTGNEVNNRMRWVNVADGQVVDVEVVDGLIRITI